MWDELAERMFDCMSDGYDDEEYREETIELIKANFEQVNMLKGDIIVEFIERAIDRIEELES